MLRPLLRSYYAVERERWASSQGNLRFGPCSNRQYGLDSEMWKLVGVEDQTQRGASLLCDA